MFGEVPGRVDPRVAEAVGGRWSRAKLWLRLAVVWCVVSAGLSVVAALWSAATRWSVLPWVAPLNTRDTPDIVFSHGIIVALAVVPLVLAARMLKPDPDGIDWRLKPDFWIFLGILVGVVEGVVLMGTAVVVTDSPWWARVGGLIIGFAVPLVATLLARRAILAEPLREIGGSEFVLVRSLRSPQGGGEDSVKITGDALRISVRTAAGRPAGQAATKDVRLADITEIGVRPSRPDDGAWAPLADGRGASLPEGDVLVLRTRTDTQLLPADPELAELLRARAALHGAEPARIEDWT
ncbi:hypothetical protein [Saccharopolyspora flava]|uniref:Uncharacterized protein n=1 Tax=Saccharopolyspora flava TaxID=95161 RepID=A0A1I6RQV2_9PSEU|nr:hypothetical protein [Saccharopolyspora flava]SFS67016.1 hypothetical protein SAMN05660874_02520 [Saccharopolyspora flava]